MSSKTTIVVQTAAQAAAAKRAAAKADLARLLVDRYPLMLRDHMTAAPISNETIIETPEFIADEVKKAADAVNQTRG